MTPPVTYREFQVLVAWRDHDGDIEAVGRQLGISPLTVKSHIQSARSKLHTRKTWVAVRLALESPPLRGLAK